MIIIDGKGASSIGNGEVHSSDSIFSDGFILWFLGFLFQ